MRLSVVIPSSFFPHLNDDGFYASGKLACSHKNFFQSDKIRYLNDDNSTVITELYYITIQMINLD